MIINFLNHSPYGIFIEIESQQNKKYFLNVGESIKLDITETISNVTFLINKSSTKKNFIVKSRYEICLSPSLCDIYLEYETTKVHRMYLYEIVVPKSKNIKFKNLNNEVFFDAVLNKKIQKRIKREALTTKLDTLVNTLIFSGPFLLFISIVLLMNFKTTIAVLGIIVSGIICYVCHALIKKLFKRQNKRIFYKYSSLFLDSYIKDLFNLNNK